MNEPISWDPSLVKKFSSSNHYKLLNQLKNEVKKYPLKNKKKTSINQSNGKHLDSNITSNTSHIEKSSSSNDLNQSKDLEKNQTTVSFNNSKNFSIYNQSIDNNISYQNENIPPIKSKSVDDSTSPTFKERLNKIDMK